MSDDKVKPIGVKHRKPKAAFLERVFPKYDECKHEKISVCEELSEVECRDCKVKLNPTWVLLQMCQKEHRLWERMRYAQVTTKALQEKHRCKCEHCGKMTRIPVGLNETKIRELRTEFDKRDGAA